MRGEGGATFPSLTTRAGWIPLGLACLESRPLINYSVDRAVNRRRRTAERTLRQPEAVSRAIKCAVLLFPSPTHTIRHNGEQLTMYQETPVTSLL